MKTLRVEIIYKGHSMKTEIECEDNEDPVDVFFRDVEVFVEDEEDLYCDCCEPACAVCAARVRGY